MGSDRFSKVVLALGALVMFALSMVGLFAPTKIVGPLGISMSGPSALNEMRVGYGSHLALAVFFAYGLMRPAVRNAALVVLGLEFGSILLSRLVSFGLDGLPGPAVYKPMALESLLFVLALAALLTRRSAPATAPIAA